MDLIIYQFIIKRLAEKFKKQFCCLGKNTDKYITFMVPIEKEVTSIYKNGERITKTVSYLLHFIAQGLCQAHYQILSIIFLKEFIKLNVNTDTRLLGSRFESGH